MRNRRRSDWKHPHQKHNTSSSKYARYHHTRSSMAPASSDQGWRLRIGRLVGRPSELISPRQAYFPSTPSPGHSALKRHCCSPPMPAGKLGTLPLQRAPLPAWNNSIQLPPTKGYSEIIRVGVIRQERHLTRHPIGIIAYCKSSIFK